MELRSSATAAMRRLCGERVRACFLGSQLDTQQIANDLAFGRLGQMQNGGRLLGCLELAQSPVKPG